MYESKPRILCFDDNLSFLKLLQTWLEGAGYSAELFHVKSLSDIDDLSHRLQTEWWHAVVADVVLLGDDIQGDRLGLDMILESDPIVPKIAFTAFPDRGWAELREVLSIKNSMGLTPAYAYIAKGESEVRTKIMDILAELFQESVSHAINFDLEIEADAGLFDTIANHMRVPSQNRDADAQELADLCRKLFPGYGRLILEKLHHTPYTGVLLRATALNGRGVEETAVIHCGFRDTMQRIAQHDREFIAFCPDAGQLRRAAETLHYGALLYRIEHTAALYEPLPRLLFQTDSARLERIINSLFIKVLRPLYQTRRKRHVAEPFAAYYRRVLSLDGHQDSLARFIRRALAEHPLIIANQQQDEFQLQLKATGVSALRPNRRRVAVPNPSSAIYEGDDWFVLEEPAPHGITHGRLDGSSVLIDPDDRLWVLGTDNSSYGFLLHDFVSLEAGLMLRSIYQSGGDKEKAMLHMLCAWLTPSTLDDPIPQPTELEQWPLLQRTLSLCEAIRTQACTLERVDIRYYYGAILFHAAQEMRRAQRPWAGGQPRHVSHTALAASLIVDRLGHWPAWELALTKPSGIVLDGNRAYVPQKRGWVSLTARQVTLLQLFLRHPHRTLTFDELTDAVWDGSIAQNTVTQAVTRLRHELEQDPQNPFYLHNITGIGYQYRPDGQVPGGAP